MRKVGYWLGLQIILFMVLIACHHNSYALIAAVNELQVSTEGSYARFVLGFTQKPVYTDFTLDSPPRLVIDVTGGEFKAPVDTRQFADTPVKSVRYYRDAHGKLRIVFDLRRHVVAQVSIEPASHRMIIEFGQRPSIMVNVIPPTKVEPKPLPKAAEKKITSSQLLRDIVVVIDPGHGGKDPGAIGRRGHREKDVVLAIAKELKRIIDKEPGFRARLTREQDVYVGLRRRLGMAREAKADLYISIHADAYKTPDAHGASVFALSARGATSEAARWLAEKENASELMGGVELGDKDALLQTVLLDLSQTHTIGMSLQIGSAMLYQLSRSSALHSSRVEQAAFVVLKSPDIPSILVETGFISNPREEQLLTTPGHQQRIAHALMQGIKHHFTVNPLDNTYFATRNRKGAVR